MHELIGRLAQFGGEGALVALFFISIVSVALITERLWYFSRRRIDVDQLARQLVALLRAGDLPKARMLAQHSKSSACSIALAGLTQADYGMQAVRHALVTATSRERLRLENRLNLLNELARISFLIGVTGTLSDLLTIGTPHVPAAMTTGATGWQPHHLVVATLAPVVAGLLVAIPAYLATGMLRVHVQRLLLECDFITWLVSSQLPSAGTHPNESLQSLAEAA